MSLLYQPYHNKNGGIILWKTKQSEKKEHKHCYAIINVITIFPHMIIVPIIKKPYEYHPHVFPSPCTSHPRSSWRFPSNRGQVPRYMQRSWDSWDSWDSWEWFQAFPTHQPISTPSGPFVGRPSAWWRCNSSQCFSLRCGARSVVRGDKKCRRRLIEMIKKMI